MPKTHILHITYDMRIGGTEMVIKNLIDGRDSDKFDMSVLCIESPLGPFAKELQKDGIQFFELNRQPGFDTVLISEIRKIIKENNIDILHCHQYTPWVYGVIAAMFTRTKVIFTEHGRFYPDSSTWKRKLINPLLNIFTHKVTAISKATKEALTTYENISARYIDVIYNGIAPLTPDTEKVSELRVKLGIPDTHLILGTVARFDPIKNHTMMLEAFAQVLKTTPNCTLLIVGDGEERQNIERCINENSLNDNVILVGYEPQPVNHIALMDIFLLSSLSEGTSMTLLEAMSIAKPCVVTDAGGNPEIVQNTVNGFVTENANAAEFALGINRVIDSIATSSVLGDASKTIFDKLFSETQMNKSFTQIYQKTLPQKFSKKAQTHE